MTQFINNEKQEMIINLLEHLSEKPDNQKCFYNCISKLLNDIKKLYRFSSIDELLCEKDILTNKLISDNLLFLNIGVDLRQKYAAKMDLCKIKYQKEMLKKLKKKVNETKENKKIEELILEFKIFYLLNNFHFLRRKEYKTVIENVDNENICARSNITFIGNTQMAHDSLNIGDEIEAHLVLLKKI